MTRPLARRPHRAIAARLSALGVLLAWLVLAAGASCAQAETLLAVTDASPPVLESFDSATPATATVIGPVTGMQSGEKMWGIATRPATGQLYGIGDTDRVYVIDPVSAAATPVGAGPFTPALAGSAGTHGVTFDPVADRLRVVSSNIDNYNLRIDPSTGVATQDTALNGGGSASMRAAAYDSQFPGADTTTLFDYDFVNDRVYLQGSRMGSPLAASSGTLSLIGPSGLVGTGPSMGMAVSPHGTAYGAFLLGSTAKLATFNLTTGATTVVGTIGPGTATINGLAVPAVSNVFAFAQSGYSVSEHGGTATITVTRSQSAGSASVKYASADGSAHAGSQYVAASGVLTFAAGASTASFTVAVIDEHAVGGTKALTLNLSAPAGGKASLGSPATATLTIADDDVAPAPAPVATPPSVTNATQSNTRWRPGSRQATFTAKRRPPIGTTFSFVLNQPAGVSFAFTQRVGGRRVKGGCVAQTRTNRKKPACKRTVTRGTLRFAAHAGTNRVSFQGRLSASKRLTPGRYTLVIAATNAVGQASSPQSLSFTIVS